MKRILLAILLAAVFRIAFLVFNIGDVALATADGAGIFSANCAQCHAGGRNLIQADKSLKKEDLEKNGMNSIEAMVTQVTNGKNAMPSFKGRLNDSQIADVAAYVFDQANNKYWK